MLKNTVPVMMKSKTWYLGDERKRRFVQVKSKRNAMWTEETIVTIGRPWPVIPGRGPQGCPPVAPELGSKRMIAMSPTTCMEIWNKKRRPVMHVLG